jgi:hypothetical protein
MVFERLHTTAPLTADPGLASARKRKGCDDDRDSNRQTERERRDSGQADVYSRPQQSHHSTPTTNGVFESRGTKSSRPPRNLPTTRKTRPFQIQSRRPKKGPCKYFFIRGFSRTKPVNKGAAKDMLHDLQQLSCLDDLFAIAPEETFRVARGIVDSFYNSTSVFEDRVFQRDTPPGRELVGRIGLFIVPQLRGDPRPLNSKDNNYLLPGPHDTDIMVKITPALIYNNDHHQHINIRTFTTKHNSDPETLENSGELKRDFVLVCQTSDDDHDNEAMHTSKPQCFTSLKFVPTSDSFEYKSPCYMSITDSQTYPRRCPWMDLGYLADGNDHITLDKILQEASTRLAAPNLEKIAKLARTALNTSSSNSIQKSTAPNNGIKSPSAPVQTQNITTLTAKVTLPLQLTGFLSANLF